MTEDEKQRAYKALRMMEWSQEAVNNFLLYVVNGEEELLQAIYDTAPVPEEWTSPDLLF